jgi:hypothetical protein
MSAISLARRLVGRDAAHPVVTLYLDLDPERFATPPARATQITSLIDSAARDVERDKTLGHDDRQALREDLERIHSYLRSEDPPYQGSRALAVFCSLRDGLFEVVGLGRSCEGFVVIERTPYVEPLIRSAQDRRWCVALVNRRVARVFNGTGDRLEERQRIEDNVQGQHDQGGWSQANYERSIEKDADDHLRRVSDMLYRRFQRERFDRLALGGPHEIVARLETFLHEQLSPLITRRRIDIDVARATEDAVQGEVATLVEEDERERERQALDQLAAGVGTGGRAVSGAEATLSALNQRRVQTLLFQNGFDRESGRCPTCGLLTVDPAGTCPVDGTPLERVDHMREAAVEAALMQDADVTVIRHFPDLGPFEGIAALLRF